MIDQATAYLRPTRPLSTQADPVQLSESNTERAQTPSDDESESLSEMEGMEEIPSESNLTKDLPGTESSIFVVAYSRFLSTFWFWSLLFEYRYLYLYLFIPKFF